MHRWLQDQYLHCWGFWNIKVCTTEPQCFDHCSSWASMQDFSMKSKSMFKKRLQCQCVVRSQCSKCQCVVPNNVPNVSVWFPMFQMSVCGSQCSKCLCVVPNVPNVCVWFQRIDFVDERMFAEPNRSLFVFRSPLIANLDMNQRSSLLIPEEKI